MNIVFCSLIPRNKINYKVEESCSWHYEERNHFCWRIPTKINKIHFRSLQGSKCEIGADVQLKRPFGHHLGMVSGRFEDFGMSVYFSWVGGGPLL